MTTFAINFTTGVLDPSITFTRTGNTATCVNSSGLISSINANIPRFDYDPVTLACRGLLIEEQRTNLVKYSEQFDVADWTKSNATVTADAAIAPTGLQTADKIIANNVAISHLISVLVAATSGTTYSLSMFFKAGEYACAAIACTGAVATTAASINLTTGVATTGAGSPVNLKSENAGNGWWRLSFSITATSTTNLNCNFYVINGLSWADRAVAGNNASGVFAFGGQVEQGASSTSYIPTVATTVTRNADVATITGTSFSDFWQAGKGGAQVQAIPSTVSGIRPLVQYDDGTANEIIALRGNTTNPELYIVDGGTPQAQLDAGTIAANTAYSLTGWWSTNDCKARKDSGAVVTDTTATIPTVTQAWLGSDGTNYLNGHLSTINYYDTFYGQPIYTRRKNKVFPSLL